MEKKVSVIIVTYNSQLLINDCLYSIFKYNDIADGLEIIIVDNMSENVDLMFSSIKVNYGSDIILVKNNQTGCYGQGNNVGIRMATSPIIMIMNPDVRLLQPIFDRATKKFQEQNVAMLGMVQMISTTKRGLSYSVILNYGVIRSLFETVICNKINYYNSKKMYINGACFFINKSIFQEIGLFDENIFMYGEENDLHHRLRNLNPDLRIVFDKAMSYLHLMNHKSLSIKTWTEMLNSNLYFCRKVGLSEKKYIKKAILNALFFKLIAYIKRDKTQIKIYIQWLQVLNTLRAKHQT